MAINHACSFVERIFEDDEFTKTVMKKRGFNKSEETNEDIENEKIVNIANEMGFKFNVEEYKTAFKTYISKLDGWDAAQKIFHILKVVAVIYKDSI